jgi:hypothetical protein
MASTQRPLSDRPVASTTMPDNSGETPGTTNTGGKVTGGSRSGGSVVVGTVGTTGTVTVVDGPSTDTWVGTGSAGVDVARVEGVLVAATPAR